MIWIEPPLKKPKINILVEAIAVSMTWRPPSPPPPPQKKKQTSKHPLKNTKQRKASKQTDRQKPLSLNSESFWILRNGMSNIFWLNDEWLTWYVFFQNPWEIISWLFLFLKRCSAWLLTFSVTWIPYYKWPINLKDTCDVPQF